MNGYSGGPVPPGGALPPSTQIPLTPQGQPVVGPPMYPSQFSVPAAQAPPAAPPAAPSWAPNGAGASADTVLDGHHVPPELRGRKLSEALRLYTALADDFVRRNRQTPQQQQPPKTQQPQQQAQPQQQQPRPQEESGDFWQNPDERITQVVQRVVGEAVRPFQQQALSTGIESTMQRVRQEIPDFQELEPDIMEIVKGSSSEALANRDYWHHAADLARGRRARQAAGQPAPQAPSNMFGPRAVPAATPIEQPQRPQPPQTQLPQGMPPATRPPTHQFFTEAPSAPSPYQGTHAGSLSAAEQQVADLAGIPHDVYSAWKVASAGGS